MRRRIDLFLLILLDFFIIVLLSIIGVLIVPLIPLPYLDIFFWSTAFLGITWWLLKFYNIQLKLPVYSKSLFGVIPLGILLGIWFIYIGEPTPTYPSLIVALLDPLVVSLAEEINYRGLLQSVGQKLIGFRYAILIQALFFALAHFRFDAIGLISYTLFGLIAGYSVKKYSLTHAIALHFVTNLTISLHAFL